MNLGVGFGLPELRMRPFATTHWSISFGAHSLDGGANYKYGELSPEQLQHFESPEDIRQERLGFFESLPLASMLRAFQPQ